jgi:hypothetical protein
MTSNNALFPDVLILQIYLVLLQPKRVSANQGSRRTSQIFGRVKISHQQSQDLYSSLQIHTPI